MHDLENVRDERRLDHFQPGADVLEISLEDGRLVTNTGFGPQHGAKVFERYVFVPAAPE